MTDALKKATDTLKQQLLDIVKRLDEGCGSHSCRVKKPTGQATNQPCRCTLLSVTNELDHIAKQALANGLYSNL